MGLAFIALQVKEIYSQPASPEKPPRPVEIFSVKNLSFGKIVAGNGDVTVTNDGDRTTTGTVQTLGSDYGPALFDIEANPGTEVRLGLNNGQDFTLYNDDGPGQLTVSLSEILIEGQEFGHNETFIMPVGKKSVEGEIGGTIQNLTQSQNSGNYASSFDITVVYE